MNYLAYLRHNEDADNFPKIYDDYDIAALAVHNFFLSYGFEIRNGKPYDPGHDTGEQNCDTSKYFKDFKVVNGRVVSFKHCDGEGPTAWISFSSVNL